MSYLWGKVLRLLAVCLSQRLLNATYCVNMSPLVVVSFLQISLRYFFLERLCILLIHFQLFPVCGVSLVPVLEVRSVPCDVRLQQVLPRQWPTFWCADPYTR